MHKSTKILPDISGVLFQISCNFLSTRKSYRIKANCYSKLWIPGATILNHNGIIRILLNEYGKHDMACNSTSHIIQWHTKNPSPQTILI